MNVSQKLRCLLVAVALIGLLPSGRAQAQVLDQFYLQVPFYRQNTIAWCWVASAKMVVDALGARSPSQCQMLAQQYGAPCCQNPGLCTRPGYIGEIQMLIANFGQHASFISPPADGFSMLATLRQGSPLVLYIDNSHFVVATGMKVVASPMGPLGIVRINDPIRGVYDIDYPSLMQRWGAALVVY